jgi:hypothetical protein
MTMDLEDRERLVRIEEGVLELNRRRDDHEGRIRLLETGANQSAGAMRVAVALSSIFGGGIASLVGWFLHR